MLFRSLYTFRQSEDQFLHQYGWLNRDQGVVHIPVEQAMRLLVQKGLPTRAQDPSQPTETPGLMPSDSSSGRVMERRRQ